jgi:hypothetical protein
MDEEAEKGQYGKWAWVMGGELVDLHLLSLLGEKQQVWGAITINIRQLE